MSEFIEFLFRNQSAQLELKTLVRNCQRIKRGALPSNPVDVEAINTAFESKEILSSFGFTADDEDPRKFFDGAVRCENHSFCVFSSKGICDAYAENVPVGERHILMDATFKIVPIGDFQQLLILYFRIKHEVFDSFFFFFFLLFSFFVR